LGSYIKDYLYSTRFTPQQELSAEQAFWLRMSNPTSKSSDASPVKIKAPKELLKEVFLEDLPEISPEIRPHASGFLSA
ncbi:hypothetical protein Tco_0470520, partial [Tanacetum coccineum]